MPEYIRAYIVILILAAISFSSIKKFTLNHIALKQFNQYKIAWFISTSLVFLSHNFWLFMILMFFYSRFLSKKTESNIALFCLLLFISPRMHETIGGIGLQYFLNIDYVRLMIISLLLPVFLRQISSKNSLSLGKNKTDIFVLLFFIVYLIGNARGTTVTDLIRQFIYHFIDVFIPYYVASRSIQNIKQLNTVLMAFFIAVIISSSVGIFEHIRHWLLYSQLSNALNSSYHLGGYLGRGSSLRALSSFGMPIAFGYMVTIAIGIYLYLKINVENKWSKRIVLIILLLGLYAPVSRGPWLGALFLYLSFLLMNKNAFKNIVKFSLISLMLFSVVLVSPYRDKAINLIPFIGKTEHHNVEYRKKLINVATKIIARNPIFGRADYLNSPEMEELYQGDVSNSRLKVDIVNTYILVALQYGLVGLIIYISMYLSTIISILKCLKKLKRKSEPIYILGTIFIAILLSMMLMIATVSPIMTIPIVNIMFLGLSISYCQIVMRSLDKKRDIN